MKEFFCGAVIVTHLAILLSARLLDNFFWISGFILFAISAGAALQYAIPRNRPVLIAFGWALFWGSLVSATLMALLMTWLAFSFPK
ncbi:hypothetical protein [Paraflavitalea pollutisoli]|uniref:hypothetical protein n=1 Tax=Paraflavitalea pollutisoli TaxID=3034143 RepID=UPI0023EC2CF7|nr:hypothetical protein [Paraflavitalea sp. H1-2-19X]